MFASHTKSFWLCATDSLWSRELCTTYNSCVTLYSALAGSWWRTFRECVIISNWKLKAANPFQKSSRLYHESHLFHRFWFTSWNREGMVRWYLLGATTRLPWNYTLNPLLNPSPAAEPQITLCHHYNCMCTMWKLMLCNDDTKTISEHNLIQQILFINNY